MILKGLQDQCMRGNFNRSNGFYLSGAVGSPEKGRPGVFPTQYKRKRPIIYALL